MNTEEKIEGIKKAIEKALKRESRLTDEALSVPGLMSLNIRHLLNNLGAISTIVCDHGSHVGGSFCSMVYRNDNIKTAIAIDSWASDDTEGQTYESAFRINATKCMALIDAKLKIIKSDSFNVDLSEVPKGIDLYYFDASHDFEAQKKGLLYYLPVLADVFIFCVDDYMLPEVSAGTQEGIKESNCEVLFEQGFVTDHEL
ncbi:MAG TPA: class I SAM-dependent methyltransferase, partial [Hanamia sp.]